MTRYVIGSNELFTFAEDKILESIIQSNVQLAFRRISRFILKFDILRNYEVMILKIMVEMSKF